MKPTQINAISTAKIGAASQETRRAKLAQGFFGFILFVSLFFAPRQV